MTADPAFTLIAIAVGVVVFGAIGLGISLRFLQNLRKDLATELGVQLKKENEAKRIDVQNPLHVKAALEFATKPELRDLESKMDAELGRERGARKKIHEEIAELQGDVKVLKVQGAAQNGKLDNLEAQIGANNSLTAKLHGQLEQMNQQFHALNNTLTQFLQNQARKS